MSAQRSSSTTKESRYSPYKRSQTPITESLSATQIDEFDEFDEYDEAFCEYLNDTSGEWYEQYKHRQHLASQEPMPTPQKPIKAEEHQIKEEPSPILPEPTAYRLTFGKKHFGKTLEEIAATGDKQYIEWMIKEDLSSQYPGLKEALHAYNSSLQDIEEQKNKNTRISDSQSSWDYVFTFPKYKGKKLSEVPDWSIQHFQKQDLSRNPQLGAALHGISLKDRPLPGALKSWRAPNIRTAPGKFCEDSAQLWISEWDTKRIFKINCAYLPKLPKVTSRIKGSKEGKPKYWLYQVWDLSRVLESKHAADEALYKFLEKNEHRMEDIMAGMGLGACLC